MIETDYQMYIRLSRQYTKEIIDIRNNEGLMIHAARDEWLKREGVESTRAWLRSKGCKISHAYHSPAGDYSERRFKEIADGTADL